MTFLGFNPVLMPKIRHFSLGISSSLLDIWFILIKNLVTQIRKTEKCVVFNSSSTHSAHGMQVYLCIPQILADFSLKKPVLFGFFP